MITALQPEWVLETGSAFGQTSHAIGEALDLNGHGHLVTLEPDRARAEHTRQRCVGLPVEVLEIPSLEYAPANPLDFLWLDSLIHLRAEEVKRFAPAMSPRAVIGMHDTGPHHQTRKYLDKIVQSGLVTQPLYLPTPRGVAFMRLSTGAAT